MHKSNKILPSFRSLPHCKIRVQFPWNRNLICFVLFFILLLLDIWYENKYNKDIKTPSFSIERNTELIVLYSHDIKTTQAHNHFILSSISCRFAMQKKRNLAFRMYNEPKNKERKNEKEAQTNTAVNNWIHWIPPDRIWKKIYYLNGARKKCICVKHAPSS